MTRNLALSLTLLAALALAGCGSTAATAPTANAQNVALNLPGRVGPPFEASSAALQPYLPDLSLPSGSIVMAVQKHGHGLVLNLYDDQGTLIASRPMQPLARLALPQSATTAQRTAFRALQDQTMLRTIITDILGVRAREASIRTLSRFLSADALKKLPKRSILISFVTLPPSVSGRHGAYASPYEVGLVLEGRSVLASYSTPLP